MIPAGVSGCEPKSNHHESDDRRMINDMCCMKCDGKFPALRAAVRLRTVITSPLLKGDTSIRFAGYKTSLISEISF